jgi:transposase
VAGRGPRLGPPPAPDLNLPPGGVPIRPAGQVVHSNPQVLERPAQRSFNKAYRRDILRQIDACTKDGQVGALMRREGLYSSLVSSWRRQEERGRLNDSATDQRPAKTQAQDPRLSQLQRENARLKARLQQAELILEIQKKASEILGISLKTLDNERID